MRVVEYGGGAGDAFENLALKVEGTKTVVQQRIGPLFPHTGRAADDHHGGGFGMGAGDRIDDTQGSDPVGYGERAKALTTRVTIGGKGGGRADMAQAGGTQPERLPAALGGVKDWVETKVVQ